MAIDLAGHIALQAYKEVLYQRQQETPTNLSQPSKCPDRAKARAHQKKIDAANLRKYVADQKFAKFTQDRNREYEANRDKQPDLEERFGVEPDLEKAFGVEK